VKKWVEEPGKIAAQEERRDSGLVSLKSHGDDVAHEFHVFPDVLRQATIRARHGYGRPPRVERLLVSPGFHCPGPRRLFLHVAYAGEILIELRLIGTAD